MPRSRTSFTTGLRLKNSIKKPFWISRQKLSLQEVLTSGLVEMPRPFPKGRGFDIIKYMKTKITLRQAQGNGERSRTITKEMKISEVMKKYPKTVFVFLDHDLHCVSCPMAVAEGIETIEEAAKVHRIDLKKFLRDLNQAAKKN